MSESDEESELLPDGWNINKTSYALRYKYQNEVFILLGMVVDDSIVLNLLVLVLDNLFLIGICSSWVRSISKISLKSINMSTYYRLVRPKQFFIDP